MGRTERERPDRGHTSRDNEPPRAHQPRTTGAPVTDGETKSGVVKRLVADKGFGFVKDEAGQEYFFHRTGVIGNYAGLYEDQRVTFKTFKAEKGPRAEEVTPA